MSTEEPQTTQLYAGIRSYLLSLLQTEGMKVLLLDDVTVSQSTFISLLTLHLFRVQLFH